MINIALPKGRMGSKIYKLFTEIGYSNMDLEDAGRKLVIDSDCVRYFLIKPQDVAIYVERGAADIGVVGKDVLLETEPDVYELLDLQLGKCALSVAAPVGYKEPGDQVLRVATKYPNVSLRYYQSLNRDIDIIKLNGSIELAPILGLSDVIVDVVETGVTLKENNLSVQSEISKSSARLIANKSSYKFKCGEINGMVNALSGVI